MSAIQFTRVRLAREIKFDDDRVKYLVIPWLSHKEFGDIVERAPDEKFNAFVNEQVHAYMNGKSPPDSIQTAVMNIADDVISGQDPVLRTGDYVALQIEFQGMK